MLVSAIVAVGENGEIGRGGKLPWPVLRKDMHWFRKNTAGKPLIMGRKTWDSLPARPLPDRHSVVLTRGGIDLGGMKGVMTATGRNSALSFASMAPGGGDEVVVIGGRQIYDLFWDQIRRIYLTKVAASYADADTFFPYPLPPDEWSVRAAHDRFFADNGLRVGFFVFDRK